MSRAMSSYSFCHPMTTYTISLMWIF